MTDSRTGILQKVGFVLVLFMVLIQAFYAGYAFIDPAGFSLVRGTALFNSSDSDWVRIYASRTLFVSLAVGYLLFIRHYRALKWVALIGLVMPVTDAWLAYQSDAAFSVVAKHLATAAYLAITFLVLHFSMERGAEVSEG